MSGVTVFIYGLIAYAVFFASFLFAIGFVGNMAVPKSIDSGTEAAFAQALLVNVILLGIFGIQHSVMARQGFKKWWTRVVPEPAERSTYVLFSGLAMFLLFWQWRPMLGVVWNAESPVGFFILSGLFWIGWLTVLISTFMIDHFDLFGLRQVYLYLRGKEYTLSEFKTPGFYKYVRHPIYVGWMIAFWATPRMTIGRLVFAIGTTGYILIAIVLEEKDLINQYGQVYAEYRKQVPKFLPRLRK